MQEKLKKLRLWLVIIQVKLRNAFRNWKTSRFSKNHSPLCQVSVARGGCLPSIEPPPKRGILVKKNSRQCVVIISLFLPTSLQSFYWRLLYQPLNQKEFNFKAIVYNIICFPESCAISVICIQSKTTITSMIMSLQPSKERKFFPSFVYFKANITEEVFCVYEEKTRP